MKMTKINILAMFTLVIASFSSYSQSVEEGLKHLNAERYAAAGLVFDKVASANPTVDNLFHLGRYYLSTPDAKANLDKAKAAFDKANELEKGSSPLAMIGLGGVKLAQGDYAGAKMLFASAVEKRRDAKNPDNFYRIAEMYTLFPWANDAAEAVINIDQALELQEVKDNAEYFKVKADAYLLKNEGGDAMNALVNAERIKSYDMADIYSTMARVWLQGRNYKEAQEAINNSIAADMKHAPAYKYQSSLYQTYQQWDKCAEAAKLYLEYSDGDCGAKLRYAQVAFNGKDFESVLQTINEIESCNTNPIVHRLEGISQYELKNPELAIPPLEKYISVAESDNIYGLDYGYLGRAYFELPDEANKEANRAKGIELIEKAIAMEDSTFDYYTYLADAYKAENKFGPAVKYFKKSIANKKAPDAADYANLGLLQYQLRDYKGADSTFDDVVKAYKGSWPQAIVISARLKTLANPNDSLYSFAYRYEEYLEALSDEEKANGSADITEALRYLAGKAFAIDKDVEKATQYLDKILEYDPTNENILNLKNQINGIKPEPEEGETTDSIPADGGSKN